MKLVSKKRDNPRKDNREKSSSRFAKTVLVSTMALGVLSACSGPQIETRFHPRLSPHTTRESTVVAQKELSIVVSKGDVVETHSGGHDLRVLKIDEKGVLFIFAHFEDNFCPFRVNFDGTDTRDMRYRTLSGTQYLIVEKAGEGKARVRFVPRTYGVTFRATVRTERRPGSVIESNMRVDHSE